MTKTTETELIQKACTDLNEEIGGAFAGSHVQISSKGILACAYFRQGRALPDDFHSASGETPLSAIDALREKYLKQKESREADLIKSAALAIISITFEHGECTDSALRGRTGAILPDHLTAKAVEMANRMSESGPFSVIAIRGANAA